MAEYEDFLKLDVRVGTIRSATVNPKARKPAYVVTIDFGPDIGEKTSSAQLTEIYTPDALVGKQIVAIMNFEPKRVAGIKSEVLVLAVVTQEAGTVLLTPDVAVPNGDRIL
jgi:tRNA-binding protein